jgi:hypothetical protein
MPPPLLRHPIAFAAIALAACFAVALAAAGVGHRALETRADAELEMAGRYAAHQIEAAFVARIRALSSVAALDADGSDPAARDEARRDAIATLVRLYPEFVWLGFAQRPGRIAVAHRDLLAGADVSGRDWWEAGLRGPFLGDVHPALLLGPILPPTRDGEPPRLLDVAVPLRDAGGGAAHGVLAGHLDAGWVSMLRDGLRDVAEPVAGIDVVLLQRDGRTPSGREVRGPGDAPVPATGVARFEGTLDGAPRVFFAVPIDGDVVVSRLGWRALIARPPEDHLAAARRFVRASLGVGVLAGLVAALAIALVAARPDAVRPRPAP